MASTQSWPHSPGGPGNRRPIVGGRAWPVVGVGLADSRRQRRLWRVHRTSGVSQAPGLPPPGVGATPSVHLRAEPRPRRAGPRGGRGGHSASLYCPTARSLGRQFGTSTGLFLPQGPTVPSRQSQPFRSNSAGSPDHSVPGNPISGHPVPNSGLLQTASPLGPPLRSGCLCLELSSLC